MEFYKSRLQSKYESEIVPQLMKHFNLVNKFEVPKLSKVVVSIGVKEGVTDAKAVDKAAEELLLITGQKPVITKSKKAIAAFKLKANVPIGCKVTLRRSMMYDFVDRFINIALPRVKDFKGLSPKKFDGCGNFSVGLKEQLIFPEINYDKIDKVKGMNIVFVTTTNNNEYALQLLKLLNFPFIS